jgi:hypothetical protein
MFPEIRSRVEYKPEEVDSRFSFLLGCHIRYGKNNSFELANAPHKVRLIIEFLERGGILDQMGVDDSHSPCRQSDRVRTG